MMLSGKGIYVFYISTIIFYFYLLLCKVLKVVARIIQFSAIAYMCTIDSRIS